MDRRIIIESKWRKRTSVILVMSLLISLFCVSASLPGLVQEADAAAGDYAFRRGTDGIEAGDYIYYGDLKAANAGKKYPGDGKHHDMFYWRVVDAGKDNTGKSGAVFLMSEHTVGDYDAERNDKIRYSDRTNTWSDSRMPAWCDRFRDNIFSAPEKAAIRSITKKESGNKKVGGFEQNGYIIYLDGEPDYTWDVYTKTDEIKDQDVFFASFDELQQYYPHIEQPGGKDDQRFWTDFYRDNGVKLPTKEWPTRTPTRSDTGIVMAGHDSVTYIFFVCDMMIWNNDNPGFMTKEVSWPNHVRPFVNIESSKVLFSNPSGAKDRVRDGEMDIIRDDGSTNKYQLTFRDPERGRLSASSRRLPEDNGLEIYDIQGAGTGENEYISAVTMDKAGNIKYYGRLANCKDGPPETIYIDNIQGKVPVGGDDELYIFSEHYNGARKSSYASEFTHVDVEDNRTFPVDFDLNGHGDPETAPETQYVKAGGYAVIPDEGPSADGYQFKGWYEDRECTKKYNSEIWEPFTLYAKWERVSYGLHYVAEIDQHGNKVEAYYEDREYDDGRKLFKASEMEYLSPPEEGAVFLGWSSEPDGSGRWFEDESTENIMVPEAGKANNAYIYAQWKDKFTVKFDTCGIGTAPADAVASPATDWKIERPEDPTDDKYRFTGWYSDETLENEWDFSDKVEKNMTLYAGWEGNPYMIRFRPGRGKGTMPDQNRNYQDGKKLPACTFKAPAIAGGAVFTGWCTSADGRGMWYDDVSDAEINPDGTENAVITLYAQWSEARIARFDLNGRGSPKPVPQMKGYHQDWLLDEPDPEPSEKGYTLTGWFTDDGDKWSFSTDRLTKALTVLNAGWVPNEYTIYYHYNVPEGKTSSRGDEKYFAYHRKYDDGQKVADCICTVEDPDDPDAVFSFTGWNTEEDGTGDAYMPGDTVDLAEENDAKVYLYAQWNNAQITKSILNEGRVGEEYSDTLTQMGLDDPVKWQLMDGELPEGISLDPDTGKINGTPSQSGEHAVSFAVTGTDAVTGVPVTLSKDLVLTVKADDPDPLLIAFIEGMNGIWKRGADSGLSFRTNGPFRMFTKLTVDGADLTEGRDYTAEEGSTVIRLKASYLNSLDEGSYILTAVYNDGQEPFTQFTVAGEKTRPDDGDDDDDKKPDDDDRKPDDDNRKPDDDRNREKDNDVTPDNGNTDGGGGHRGTGTGDENHLGIWLALMAASASAAAGMMAARRRRSR